MLNSPSIPLSLTEYIPIHSAVFSLHGLQLRSGTLWCSFHSKLTIFFILPTATLPTAGNMDNAEAEYISRCYSDGDKMYIQIWVSETGIILAGGTCEI
jgi:hypothetical protein